MNNENDSTSASRTTSSAFCSLRVVSACCHSTVWASSEYVSLSTVRSAGSVTASRSKTNSTVAEESSVALTENSRRKPRASALSLTHKSVMFQSGVSSVLDAD